MSGRAFTYRGRGLSAGLAAVLFASLLAAAPAAAQNPSFPTAGDQVPTTAPTITAPVPPRNASSSSAVPLEGVVDAEVYMVGPGDIFAFAIGGRLPMEQRAVVTADGMLIVPEVGSFRVAARSLASVRAELRAALRRRYTNIDTDAALAEPRRFVVHVSGNVALPGRHAVGPVARLEDALAAAMGESPLTAIQRQRIAEAGVLPSLRNVEVRHPDGTVESLDLLRYYATGDTRFNPYIYDGDVILVPSYTASEQAVFVEDRYGEPAAYDFRLGDTAADLLTIARGPGAERAVQALRVLRVRPDGSVDVETIEGAALATGAARDVVLQPLDRIRIVEQNLEIRRVEAVGEVRFPGTYPIVEGETTLRQLVEMAGGFTSAALTRGAYLERRGSAWPASDAEVRYRRSLDDITTADRVAFMETQAYETGRLSGLPFESTQFLTRELLTFQRLSIDLSAVLSGAAPDVALREGDRLVVPDDAGGVLIVGQVQRPGIVPYRPDTTAEVYIAVAGGLGPAATEVYLRDAASGALRPAAGAEIRSGDVLFVDRVPAAYSDAQQSLLLQRRQIETQARRDRAEARSRTFSAILGVVGTALSAVTLYIALQNTSGN